MVPTASPTTAPPRFACPLCGASAATDRDTCPRCGGNLVAPVDDHRPYQTIVPLCGSTCDLQRSAPEPHGVRDEVRLAGPVTVLRAAIARFAARLPRPGH